LWMSSERAKLARLPAHGGQNRRTQRPESSAHGGQNRQHTAVSNVGTRRPESSAHNGQNRRHTAARIVSTQRSESSAHNGQNRQHTAARIVSTRRPAPSAHSGQVAVCEGSSRTLENLGNVERGRVVELGDLARRKRGEAKRREAKCSSKRSSQI
jgi:hypothetical protein